MTKQLVNVVMGLACVCLVWSASIARADEIPLTIQTRINTISLFKNGLGFIRREADITKGDCVIFDKLPVPIHGTFWVYPPISIVEPEVPHQALPRRMTIHIILDVNLLVFQRAP